MCQDEIILTFYKATLTFTDCYGRPLLQAWLLPNLNTMPDNCDRKNFL